MITRRLPAGLGAELTKLAAMTGHRAPDLILAAAARDHLHLVTPKPRRPGG